MSIIETLKTIVQIIPLIVRLITEVEDIIPISGAGKQKLEYVMTVLNKLSLGIDPELIESIISATVTLFNATNSWSAVKEMNRGIE